MSKTPEDLIVKVRKNQARFKRIKSKGQPDKGFGYFYIEIDVETRDREVLIPLSIASGKKVAGFMYLIEGTAEGKISTASVDIESRKEDIYQIKIGTLLFSKIPPKTKATFRIKIEIKGNFGKLYKVVINQINYKLSISDVRYHRFSKVIESKKIKFS